MFSTSLLLSLLAIVALVECRDPRVTDKVYFDIEIGGRPIGKIVIGVFGEIVPKTAKNFVELAKRGEVRGNWQNTMFFFCKNRLGKKFRLRRIF